MATGQPKLIISSNVSARHVQHGYAFRCKVIFIKTSVHYCFKLLFYLCARRARIRLALNYVGQVLMNELYLIVRVLCLIVNIINCCKCAYCWKIKFLVLVESISALLYPVVYKMQKFFQFQRFFAPRYSFCRRTRIHRDPSSKIFFQREANIWAFKVSTFLRISRDFWCEIARKSPKIGKNDYTFNILLIIVNVYIAEKFTMRAWPVPRATLIFAFFLPKLGLGLAHSPHTLRESTSKSSAQGMARAR